MKVNDWVRKMGADGNEGREGKSKNVEAKKEGGKEGRRGMVKVDAEWREIWK